MRCSAKDTRCAPATSPVEEDVNSQNPFIARRFGSNGTAWAPLEKLFRLELEFHRGLRTQALGTADASSLHTGYALQTGYEQLIPAIGIVTARQIEQLRERFTLASDTRDLLAARDSLKQLLGLSQLDG
jgi:hypothetical protein